MKDKNQPKLRFHGVDIVRVDFNSSERYNPEKSKVKINSDAKVFYPKNAPKLFNILMEVSVEAVRYFNIKIYAIGLFECNQNIDTLMKNNFVNGNAPAIMFPYIRSFISTFTSSLGNVTGTITVPVRFFKDEIQEIVVDDVSSPSLT